MSQSISIVLLSLCFMFGQLPAHAAKSKKGKACKSNKVCPSGWVCKYALGKKQCVLLRKIGQTCSNKEYKICHPGYLCGFRNIIKDRCIKLQKLNQRCGKYDLCLPGFICRKGKCKSKIVKKVKKRAKKKVKRSFLGKIARGIKKTAKKVARGTKKAAKKTGKAVKKAAKKTAAGVKKAAKLTAKAANALKRKMAAFAKSWARKAKSRIQKLIVSTSKKQGKKAVSLLRSKIKAFWKTKLHDAASKLGMGKSALAKQFGKSKRGSQFKKMTKNSLKKLKKGGSGVIAFLVSLAADAGAMFAYSAAYCGIKKHAFNKERGSFGNCFADKAANGTFEYFYGVLIGGLVMDAATYTILAPVVMSCISAVTIAIPGPGLFASGACVPVIQSITQEVLDSAIKQEIKGSIWTSGPNYYKSFYRIYGGK